MKRSSFTLFLIQTRLVLAAVLNSAHAFTAEADHYHVTCFVHKTATQYSWGISVWRAFPLERSAFFTVRVVWED